MPTLTEPSSKTSSVLMENIFSFLTSFTQITAKIADKLFSLGENVENAMEKIHFAMDVIQSFSHEFVFDKHEYIDYIVMKDMVIKLVKSLFE